MEQIPVHEPVRLLDLPAPGDLLSSRGSVSDSSGLQANFGFLCEEAASRGNQERTNKVTVKMILSHGPSESEKHLLFIKMNLYSLI